MWQPPARLGGVTTSNYNLKIEAVYSPETLVITYQTTWYRRPEDHYMNRRHEDACFGSTLA